MTRLKQIEKSVLELSPEELKAFSEWFETVMEKTFDEAIERDVRSGKLDALADKAILELRSGRTRAL